MRARIAQHGCELPKTHDQEPITYSKLLRNNFGPACRELTLSALKSLKVDAIRYYFSADAIPGCRLDQSAFIFLNPSSLPPGSIQFFSPETPSVDPKVLQEKIYTQALFSGWKQLTLWSELDRKSKPGFEQWKKKYLWNCQPLAVKPKPVPIKTISCSTKDALPLSSESTRTLEQTQDFIELLQN
jgi:hypothetical protein